jgi:N-acyl-D-amino-acid deacylase
MTKLSIFLLLLLLAVNVQAQTYDVIIRGGTVYDGSGRPPVQADLAIVGDKIVKIGRLDPSKAKAVIDATGLAVAPGFINMLSWSTESLIIDPRSLGELKQGVTTQVMGEGGSMGPLNDRTKKQMKDEQGRSEVRHRLDNARRLPAIPREARRFAKCRVIYRGDDDSTVRDRGRGQGSRRRSRCSRCASWSKRRCVRGALGIGTSLIYAPAFYAKTEELIEMCKVAAKYKGKYISHMRSEGNRLEEAVDELIRISREAKIPAEIYHLKAAGKENWGKMDRVIAKVEAARKSGMKITADMYNYPAGATGLDASMPPWVLDGGYPALFKRIRDPETRKKIIEEMRTPTDKWENLGLAAGSPERILLVGFKNEKLKPLTGKTLAEGRKDARH